MCLDHWHKSTYTLLTQKHLNIADTFADFFYCEWQMYQQTISLLFLKYRTKLRVLPFFSITVYSTLPICCDGPETWRVYFVSNLFFFFKSSVIILHSSGHSLWLVTFHWFLQLLLLSFFFKVKTYDNWLFKIFSSQILNLYFEDLIISLHLFLFNPLHFLWFLNHSALFSIQELVLKHFLMCFFKTFLALYIYSSL